MMWPGQDGQREGGREISRLSWHFILVFLCFLVDFKCLFSRAFFKIDFTKGAHVLFQIDVEAVKPFLEKLTPANSFLFVKHNGFTGSTRLSFRRYVFIFSLRFHFL